MTFLALLRICLMSIPGEEEAEEKEPSSRGENEGEGLPVGMESYVGGVERAPEPLESRKGVVSGGGGGMSLVLV